jgi:maltooligosyltrehalose trehalohydrolase
MLLQVPQLKAIAAMTLLSPFVPLLFQGEEWGAKTPFMYFTDHEPELGRLVAEGRSKEFSSFDWQGAIPNPQDPATFTRSKLDWSELSDPAHADIYDWHRRLIVLRRSVRGASKATVSFDAEAQWLKLARGDLLCVFNFAPIAQRVKKPRGAWDLVLRSDMPEAKPADNVPAHATFVYRRRAGA